MKSMYDDDEGHTEAQNRFICELGDFVAMWVGRGYPRKEVLQNLSVQSYYLKEKETRK